MTDQENDEFSLPEIDTPINLRPDLSQFGIEEVDRGICLDTGENRRVLRHNKMVWISMYDVNGAPLNTLEVRSREMVENAGLEALKRSRSILSNPNDKNSDYLTGEDLIYEPDARDLVPNWVLASTRDFLKKQAERDAGKVSKRPTTYIMPPGRCKVIKSDGIRCRLWHGGRESDNGMCRTHVGTTMNTAAGAIEKARNRVQNMAPAMMDVLEDLAYNATSEPVRMQSANSLLDRAGVRGGVEVDHTVQVDAKPAADVIAERLKRLMEGSKKAEELKQIVAGVDTTEETPNPEVIEDAVLIEESAEDDDDF